MKWLPVLGLRILVALVVLTTTAGARVAGADQPENLKVTCVVPNQRSTIQAAVNDPSCTTIQIQAGTFPEIVRINRDLTLVGAGIDLTTITGEVVVSGAGVVVLMTDFAVDTSVPGSAGCFGDAIQVGRGAEALAVRVRGLNAKGSGPCLVGILFADGFETGNTNRWSSTVGGP